MSGCTPDDAGAATDVENILTISLNQTESHPSYLALTSFGEQLAGATEGRWGARVYANEALGAQQEVVQLVSDGSVDMAVISAPQVENLSMAFRPLNLPGAFVDIEHQTAVLKDDSIVGELFGSLEEERRLRVLGGFTQGSRHVYTDRGPIEGPDDLAGLKIRVQESDVFMELTRALGGSPTPMAYGEVYTALQAGVLNGAENNEVSYVTQRHYEIVPFFTLTNHLQRMFTGASSFTLLAIPFFVLAGSLMNTGGIAERLIDAAKVLVGRLPGSLAQTNVVANALFGSVSGAAVASAAAMGSTLGPRMKREGYQAPVSAAVNAASAPAGMMIPPSNTLIVYSLVSSTSVATLFVAGYGPGLVWVLACLVVVAILARTRPGMRARGERVPLGLAVITLLKAVPAILMIVIVIGGLLAGFFTATESAVIAVGYSFVLGLVYRQLTLKNLPTVIAGAARTTAVVMLLVAVSSALSWVLSYAMIPQSISSALLGLADSKTVILVLMMLILLIVGAFMDPTPAILIFTPIFLPIALELGVDPIHFGLMITFNLSLGTITPPVGNILFIAAKVGNVRVEPVIRQMLPFFGALLIGLLLVVFVPQITMALPDLLGMSGAAE